MKKIIVLGMVMTMLLAGCSTGDLSDPTIPSGVSDVIQAGIESGLAAASEQVTGIDYSAAVQTIDTFQDSFGQYVFEEGGAGETIRSEGTTLLGQHFDSSYFESTDGIFKKATFEVERDGILMVDEYFRMTDNLVLATRSYLDSDSHAVIERYLISGDSVYQLDDVNQVLIRIEDMSAIDMFSSFEQVEQFAGVS